VRREVHARCGRGPAGNDRRKRRHRARGPTSLPGDGAAGDQGAQNRPACPTMAATRTPAACPVSTTSWRYGLRRTYRLVTGRSHRPRSTWPNQARLAFLAVTHRYNRTHCLWLEPFQIADSARLTGVPITRMITHRSPSSGPGSGGHDRRRPGFDPLKRRSRL
jgi:hypothetical protein